MALKNPRPRSGPTRGRGRGGAGFVFIDLSVFLFDPSGARRAAGALDLEVLGEQR